MASDFPHVPGYELQSELGRGGMATVYRAIETNLGREVAIKVVSGGAGDPDGHIERLENEARGLAALHHPHIVDLYAFGRLADGSLFYAMPLLPGGSLEDWPKPVPEERVVALLEPVLDALGYAHTLDIIHRDIKPANILFDRHDRPLLADFGAALMRRRTSRLTSHGGAIGSSGYMSPEQARGTDVDARSDLYSTAVLAYELLTGRRPFEGPDDLSIALAQTEQPIPTLPPALAHWQPFFARALAVNPAQRFVDAADMRLALRALRHAPPPVARPNRHRMVFIAAAILLFGAVAFAVAWWKGSAEPVRAEAVEALFAAGRLTPPDDPNVLAELARARTQELDRARLDALQGQLLDRLATEVGAALDGRDAAAIAPTWQRWQEAVETLDAARDPRAIAHAAAIEGKLREQLTEAHARYDRAAANAALAVVNAWSDAPADLRRLADDTQAMAAVGERFTEAGEPELVLAKAADGSRPALAVMAAPVDAPLYQRYVKDRGRSPVACAVTASAAQGCLDLTTATDLSRWLAEQTRHTYRVPTRDELAATVAQVETAPVVAWTSTCHEVRVAQPRNAASRTWSGVRKLFGKSPTAQRVETKCDGHYALKLDGQGGEASVRTEAAPDAVVVLVREMGGEAPRSVE